MNCASKAILTLGLEETKYSFKSNQFIFSKFLPQKNPKPQLNPSCNCHNEEKEERFAKVVIVLESNINSETTREKKEA